MEVVHTRCSGLDVHKNAVVACVRVHKGRRVARSVRTFNTTTSALFELADWLREQEVTHVAMEATGVYWKPVWHILEGSFELLLAHAQHVRNVPGRKSDVNDATWIADLLAHGLIQSSFVPPRPIQELRGLTRTRKQLVREVAQHTLRVQKTLEDANIKLSSVVSDTLGVSSRAVIGALVQGETDPERLADLTTGRLRASRSQLVEAFRGHVTAHHRFLLKLHMDQIAALQQGIAALDREIERVIEPFRPAVELLTTIPGVSETVAQVILAEVGDDMSRFQTPGHLVSWAGLCPRMDESAGKRRSTRVRPGAPWLKAALTQAAWAASHSKNSYLRAQFVRLRARRGPKKAIVAVAASILVAMHHMLSDGVVYHDLGVDYFDRRNKAKLATRLARRIRELGFQVDINPAA